MLAVIFPGQGSQEKGMGVEVFGCYPGLVQFASDVLGYDLISLCTEDPGGLLARTEYTQPALYVVNALRAFERVHREDRPADFYLGHSLGEYNALLAAGVFDFETGLRLVARRGELMAAASDGGMTAVMNIPAKLLLEIFADDDVDGVDIAGLNTGSQVVIAGTPPVLAGAHACLKRKGIRFVPLKVSAPFHSRYMEPARVRFAEFLTQFSFAEPVTPVVANVTGRPYEPGQVARMLTEQLVAPVRWTDSVHTLLDCDVKLEFSEIGGLALTQMVQKIKAGVGQMATTDTLRQYLEDCFLFEFDDVITPDTDLFKAGVIDSFGYVRMMKFLESEFSVEITSEDILMNVFVSLTAIVGFVSKKISAS